MRLLGRGASLPSTRVEERHSKLDRSRYLAEDRGDAPVQVAIRTYVERELLAQKVYEQLCARLGLCDAACFPRSRTPWAKGKCARRDLVRYENWVSQPRDAVPRNSEFWGFLFSARVERTIRPRKPGPSA